MRAELTPPHICVKVWKKERQTYETEWVQEIQQTPAINCDSAHHLCTRPDQDSLPHSLTATLLKQTQCKSQDCARQQLRSECPGVSQEDNCVKLRE